MKHTHERVPNRMVFRVCPKCGAGAGFQWECKICGKTFCGKCAVQPAASK